MSVRATIISTVAIAITLLLFSTASAATAQKSARAKAKAKPRAAVKAAVHKPTSTRTKARVAAVQTEIDEQPAKPKPSSSSNSGSSSSTKKPAAKKKARPAPVIEPAYEGPEFFPDEHIDDSWEGGYAVDTTCGIWTEVDYLLWQRQGRNVPALVTTEPDGGVLPGATVLFGAGEIGDEIRPGGRVRLGTYLDNCNCWSLEGSFLMLGDGNSRFSIDSSTTPTIARPFFNLTEDLQGNVVGQDAVQVATAGFATGTLLVDSGSDVWAADITLRRPLCQSGLMLLDVLAGYQTSRIDEDLLISSTSVLTGGTTTINVVDSFSTENEFHGGHIGLELARVYQRWDLQLLGKVGMGSMRQEVQIQGSQTVTVAGTTSTTNGGLLAQPTNIGVFSRNVFAVSPEVGLNVRFHLNCHFEVTAGYSFLYWNRVAQPGDQIDLSINPDQPPASAEPQRPAFTFHDNDYFLHGAHVGAQWNF